MSSGEKDFETVRKPIENLMTGQKLAVLATQGEGRPYANLVAFASAADMKKLFFVTPKGTRKYRHLMDWPRAALLIDNRDRQGNVFDEAGAVTVEGSVTEVPPEQTGDLMALFLSRHPELERFVQDADCALMQLTVERLVVVRGLSEVVTATPPA